MKKDTATHTRATHTTGQPLPTPTDEELRAVAIKRVKAKRDFRGHLYVYLVVNIGLWTMPPSRSHSHSRAIPPATRSA